MKETEHNLFYGHRGCFFLPVLGPNFFVYEPIFKIRSSKLVRIVSETDQDR